MIHDAVDDMPEEFRAHGIQKVVFRLEVGIKVLRPIFARSMMVCMVMRE